MEQQTKKHPILKAFLIIAFVLALLVKLGEYSDSKKTPEDRQKEAADLARFECDQLRNKPVGELSIADMRTLRACR